MSKSTLTPMHPSMDEFGKWLRTPGFRTPKATVLHHTFSPSAAQYKGRETIVAIRSYHTQQRGWSDIGANAYACPDGFVITGRPLDTFNWAHAYISRTYPEPEAWKVAGGDRGWFNKNAFGLETVANFDKENPRKNNLAAASLECALDALTIVHKVFNIPPEMLFFHRDVAPKSCPGKFLDRKEIREELARRLRGSLEEPKIVLGNKVIECKPLIVGGEVTVEALPLLQALNVNPSIIPPGIIHQNGRAYLGELSDYIKGWAFFYSEMPQGPRVYVKKV